MDLTFEISMHGAWTVLCVGGEVDLATADQLQLKLEEILTDPRCELAVDLSEVSFMDSTGVSALAGAARTLAERGRELAVLPDRPILADLFEITHLTDVLKLYGSRADLPDTPPSASPTAEAQE